MQEIGKFLKENRIQNKLSINDVSSITKMNINIIKNIESGNIEYFSNDLTYLRYYVKSYANAVNVDFDSLVGELEKSTLSYTQNLAVLEDEKIQKLNENIKARRFEPYNPLQKGGGSKASGVDWTLVSLITIIALIGAFLVYSIIVNLKDKEANPNIPPVVDKQPTDDNGDEDEDVVEAPIVKAVEVTKEDPNTYLISNWQKQNDFSIKTEFNVNTWVQIKVNDTVINPPGETVNSKTYLVGEELVLKDSYKTGDVETDFKAGDVISIRYGIMRGNKFIINDEQYQLDESIADATGGTDVIFKLDSDVE